MSKVFCSTGLCLIAALKYIGRDRYDLFQQELGKGFGVNLFPLGEVLRDEWGKTYFSVATGKLDQQARPSHCCEGCLDYDPAGRP